MTNNYSVRDPWMKVRPEVAEVDDLMTADGAGGTPKKNWAARDTAIVSTIGNEGRDIPLGAMGLSIALMGLLTAGDIDDETCTVNIWVYQPKGPAEFVASAVYTFGKQEVVEDPTIDPTVEVDYKYADTVSFTDQGWPNDKISFSPPDKVGSEDIALITFSIYGAIWVKVEIAALSNAAMKVVPIFKYSS